MTPEHLDYLRQALSAHALLCEAGLLLDNVARVLGASSADSLWLAWRFLRACGCLP
ncbi:MAG: hypothetical protein BroJett033_7910 [Chloroflexota bacterium]|nr:MAG: hypothetical protein BroJett033_7910 [Chloroflexota bacterium]